MRIISFYRIGSIIYPSNSNDFEKFLDFSIETDSKDIIESGEFYEIITNLESFNDIREKFSSKFGDPDEANIIWKSKENVDLNENSIHTILSLLMLWMIVKTFKMYFIILNLMKNHYKQLKNNFVILYK